MGIRRRRKKLTTVITTVDRRLRGVESRVVPTRIAANAITAVELAPDAIPTTDPKDSGATGATPSDTDPSEFAIITAAAYSPKNITGSDDWIDITTAQPHKLVVGEKVSVYGLNNNGVNASGNYIITEVGSTTTFRYKVGLTGYYPAVVNLDVSATVTQRSCTLTEATLILSSSTHGFVVGDVITVSGVDASFNGTFYVSSVNGSTIKYKFITAVSSSVPLTASSGLVRSVAHKYTIIGDTWIDTSVTPNVYKIWDGLSWQLGTSLPEGVIINDNMAPAAPTGLSADTNGYYNPNTGSPSVAVTLTWTAPTTNADATPLTDLAGYKVFYKYNNALSPEDGSEPGDPSNEWVSAGDTNETTLSMRDFNIASTIDFAVQAYDSSRMNYSVYSDTLSVETGTPAIVLNPPSTPTVEARLGTVTVSWDGNDNTAATPPPTLAYVNVYLGSSSGFTPGPATLKGQIAGTGADSLIITGLTYGTTYYAKLIFVSTTGTTTAASSASAAVTVVALVDTDVIGQVISGAKITPGTINAAESIVGLSITGDLIRGNTIEAGSIKTNSLTADQIFAGALDAFQITGGNIRTAATGSRIVINSNGLTAYAANGTTETFKIASGTGNVTISGYLSVGGAANDVNNGGTTINGGKITANTIAAESINAGTLTGFTIRTAAPGTSVRYAELSGTSIGFYDEYGNFSGNIVSAGIARAGGLEINSASNTSIGLYNGSLYLYGPGTTVDVGGSGNLDIIVNAANNVQIDAGTGNIQLNGKVRIATGGDSSPTSTLHPFQIGSSTGVNLRIDNNEIIAANNGSASTLNLNIGGTVNVGGAAGVFANVIGTTGTRDVYITSAGILGVSSTSSRRFKNNIQPLTIDVDKVLAIEPVTFKYNSNIMSSDVEPDLLQLGFIAEDLVAADLDILVGYDSEGLPDSIQYSRYIIALQAVVRELSSRINQLSARVDSL